MFVVATHEYIKFKSVVVSSKAPTEYLVNEIPLGRPFCRVSLHTVRRQAPCLSGAVRTTRIAV